jgi:hypothetical protein
MLATLAPVLSGVGVAPATNSYFSIATVNVGSGGASTISFTSIPSTYTHLQIRAIARTNAVSGGDDNAVLKINNDTGANYSFHQMYGTGSGVGATGYASQNPQVALSATNSNAAANLFGVGIMDILDYSNNNKYKTVRMLTGQDTNGGGVIIFRSLGWYNSSAITQLDLIGQNGSFVQYSSFALYGVK